MIVIPIGFDGVRAPIQVGKTLNERGKPHSGDAFGGSRQLINHLGRLMDFSIPPGVLPTQFPSMFYQPKVVTLGGFGPKDAGVILMCGAVRSTRNGGQDLGSFQNHFYNMPIA
jgi:hypothetical protein